MRLLELSRRAFLVGSLGALARPRAWAAGTPPEEVPQLPLVDAHSHYVSRPPSRVGYTPDELLKALNDGGIKRMVVLGFGETVPELARRYPDRFIASYVGVGFRARQARGEIRDGTAPEEVKRVGAEFDAALRSGAYRGLGEIHTLARPIPAATGGVAIPGATISPDSPLVLRLFELAAKYSMPINVHCEDHGVPPMVKALRARPKTVVVWAHTGSYLAPSAVRGVLQEHPNVWFDLSAKNPACCQRGVTTYPLLGASGSIDGDWRELFEAHPDRFLVGVDFFAADQLREARAAGELYRRMLAFLTPATARKIAYENAERLYGLRA